MTTRKNFPRNKKLRQKGALERLEKRIKVLDFEKANDGKLEKAITEAAILMKRVS